VDVVSSGGEGAILRAIDHHQHRQVALKMREFASEDELEATRSECRVLLSVTPHPALPIARDDLVEGGRHYLVVDWIEGSNLQDLVDRTGGRGLPLRDVLGHLSAVADGLDHLHALDPPVAHGDVKPANVILTPSGRVVLVDFGLAGRGAARTGSHGFTAPEVSAGARVCPASDIYGFAATAFALLTGAAPAGVLPDWEGLPPSTAQTIERALRCGMAVDPSKRPRSARAFIDMLTAWQEPAVHGHNLPAETTSFFGRRRETTVLRTMLREARLVTLTGPGGSGKTRLALSVARDEVESFADGVWLVELAALTDADLVAHQMASVLNVREEAGVPVLDAVIRHVATTVCLVVLDNCEHLVESCAAVLQRLLRSAPAVRVIATSREALGIPGETVFAVSPLPVPSETSVEESAACESVALFVDRAARVLPAFALDERSAAPVVRICRELEGIPLAIELAAARVRHMRVDEIAQRLDDRLDLLAAGRGLQPRQQTLRAVVDWGHELLSANERTLFRRLAAFAGGCTLDAASDVCGFGLDELGQLVDKSFLTADTRGPSTRYRMLETLRLYARERLEDAGEGPQMFAKQAAWMTGLADRAASQLSAGDEWWLSVFDDERDNLRQALGWAREHDLGMLLALAGSVWPYWYVRGQLQEGRAWLDAALDGAADSAQTGPVRTGAGVLAMLQGALDVAADHLTTAGRIFRENGDRRRLADVLNNLGNLEADRGNFDEAVGHYEDAIGLFREMGERHGVAVLLNNIGLLYADQGLADRGAASSSEALELFRSVGDKRGSGHALLNLAGIAARDGDVGRARDMLCESLAFLDAVRDTIGTAECIEGLAAIEPDPVRAARLFGAAQVMRERAGSTMYGAADARYERDVSAVRDALGTDFDRAWAEGRALGDREAVSLAAGAGQS
jgi:non-specific serine/threonine protein kinase